MAEEKETTSQAVIQPTRSPDYDMRATTGFLIRGMNKDTLLLEPFVDLPPIRRARDDKGESVTIIERKFLDSFLMGRDEMRELGKKLIEAADREPGKEGPQA